MIKTLLDTTVSGNSWEIASPNSKIMAPHSCKYRKTNSPRLLMRVLVEVEVLLEG